MLTTTRREIINDYDISQNKQLRNFAPEYNYTCEQETVKDYQDARQENNYSRHYMSKSELAQRLYGEDYRDGYESVENNAENYSNPDLMPSMQTMQATQNAYYRPMVSREERNATTKQKLSTRSKILIASYAAVLLDRKSVV